jgi:hypothetical protein
MEMLKKPLIIFVAALALLALGVLSPQWWYARWTLVFPTAFLAMMMSALLWPSGGVRGYFSYRTPQVVFTMYMELWIVLGGIALQWPVDRSTKDFWFQVFLATFFLWTASNTLPWMSGRYRKGVALRPDLIFGGGSYLVRGEIFVALGIIFLTTRGMARPIWNWWALTGEIAAMLALIALRGVLKAHMRRARLLGLPNWMARTGMSAALWLKEIALFVGLLAVVYMFDNMYTGRVPFTWGPPLGPQLWPGIAWLALAFMLVVPLRGWYKAMIAEPAPFWQEFGKHLLLWAAFVVLIYGYVLVFMGKPLHLQCCGYYSFGWGLWMSVLGFLMVVPLRTVTIREELRGMIGVMMGVIADMPEPERQQTLTMRFKALAAMPQPQRTAQMRLMMRGVERLPVELRDPLMQTRERVLALLSPHDREAVETSVAQARA